jgi:hypothetical protein
MVETNVFVEIPGSRATLIRCDGESCRRCEPAGRIAQGDA